MLVFFIRIRPSKPEKATTLTRQHRQRFQTAEQLALRAFPRLPPLFCLSRTDPSPSRLLFTSFCGVSEQQQLPIPFYCCLEKKQGDFKISNGFYP
ncbi:hypothetical protein MTR67_042645 [Solanum verrucosum]|uniref:Uncharacterized protein n=1 Tax=Solanum verrucosum TaxID=315347 RepID=A0AAF0UNV0_SOLVR|nr:hypothetical protein MTR67_042645 [Solanum verrucosum]